jgi:hypothetical protein
MKQFVNRGHQGAIWIDLGRAGAARERCGENRSARDPFHVAVARPSSRERISISPRVGRQPRIAAYYADPHDCLK